MATCPNKSLDAWKQLVTAQGEDMAYYLWNEYDGNVPESYNTSLEDKLTQGFLKDFNITATEYKSLKDDLGLDAVSAADVVTKSIAYQEGESILPEVAYFAYSMLGKQNNKIKSELRYLVGKWDKYTERFAYHKNVIKDEEGYVEDSKEWQNKVRDRVIIDFLREKLMQQYYNPQAFEKDLDSKWTREDFSMWRNILEDIREFLEEISNFIQGKNRKEKVDKLNNLALSIADEVLNNNYVYFNYELGQDQIRKYYNQTIEGDDFAKSVVEHGQKEVGLVLTGSLALRRAGEVYRTADETLHDIDWVVPNELVNATEEDTKVTNEILGYSGILDATSAANQASALIPQYSWFKKFTDKFPTYQMINSFYGAEHQKDFGSLTIQGVIDGEFYTEKGFHEEEISYYRKDPETKKPVKVKETIRVKHKKGDWIKDSGYVIDFFVRLTPNQEEHDNYFKLWKEIMVAKLKMGRDKDFIDWKAFLPYVKSKDKFNFYYQGFTHQNYESSQDNAFDDQVIQAPAQEAGESQLQIEDMQMSVASPQAIEKMKQAGKNMGISYEGLQDYAKRTGLDVTSINGLADITHGIVALAEGREDVAIVEETVHIATAIVDQTNPSLVTEMISKIDRFKIYKDVFELYKNNPNYQLPNGKPDIRKIKKEAVDKLITEVIVNKLSNTEQYPELREPENVSLVKRMWQSVLDFIKGIYRKNDISVFEETADQIIGGQVGLMGDMTGQGTFYQIISPKQKEIQDKIAATKNSIEKIIDKQETPDPLLSDSEEATNYYERTTADNKKVRVLNRVTDRVQAWYKQKFPNTKFTEAQQQMNEIKRIFGVKGHLDFEGIHNRYYNEDGTKREKPLPSPSPREINLPNMGYYQMLENYYVDLINSLPKNEETGEESLVFSEVMLYDEKIDEAGTIDILVVTPEGDAMILDWKFMTIGKTGQKTNVLPDVAWYKQGAFGIQLNRYKEMLLSNYGINTVLQKKAIPIAMDIKFSKTRKSTLEGLAIGSINPAEIKEPYLIPVTDDAESTGYEELDEILNKMRSLITQVGKQNVTNEEEKQIKKNKLDAMRQAVRIVQATYNINPLIAVINSMVRDGEHIFNDYNTIYKDRPAKSSDNNDAELSRFSNDMSTFIKVSELFQNIGADLGHLYYTKEMEEAAETEEEKANLAANKSIVETMDKAAKELYILRKNMITAQSDFADKHIGQRNNVTNLLSAEKIVAGLSSLFRGVSELPLRSLQLLYKLTRAAQGKASADSLEQVKELMEIRERLMKRGNVLDLVSKIYQKDSDGKIANKLIRKFSKQFYEEVSARALEGGDKEWIRANVDMEAYKEEALQVIQTRIDRIKADYRYDSTMSLEEQGMSEEEYQDMMDEITDVQNEFDTSRNDFSGYDNYVLKRHPKDIWLSDEYKAIDGDPDLKDLYSFIQKVNKISKEVGYIDNTVASTFLPFLRKSMAEEFAFTNPLSAISNFNKQIGNELSINKADVGWGNINEVTGELENSIPKYYTYDFTRKEDGVNDYSEVSQDIFKNMILYLQQVNKYKYLSEVEGQINLIKSVEQFKDHHLRTNNLNEVVLDENGNPIKEKGNDQNVKMFDDFMRVLLYDQKFVLSDTDVPLHLNKVLNFMKKAVNASMKPITGRDVWKENENATPTSLMKSIDAANRWFQLKTLGFEGISGAVNMFGGNIQLLAQAGNYFDAREVFANEALIIGQDFRGIVNRKKGDSEKVFFELLNTFMPMKDDPAYDELQKAGISKLTRVNFGDALMFFMRKPEQWLEKSVFVTLLQNSMVENGRIINIKEYVKAKYKDRYDSPEAFQNSKKMKEEIRQLKETRSIMKTAKLVDGKLDIEGLNLNDRTEIQRLTELTRRISRNATGGMSDGDVNRMSMSIWTKSMMVFKNWIPKLADTRFSEFRKVSDDFSVIIDENGISSGEKYDIGRIRLFGRVFMDMLNNSSDNFVNLLKMNEAGIKYADKLFSEFGEEYKKQTGEELTMTREDFIDMIRNNIRKQLQELLILASLLALSLSLGLIGPDDDDDKASKNLHNYALRVTDKFVNELSFFYNPKELQNLLSGGMFPAIGVVTDFGKFMSHFFQEITGEDFDAKTDADKARKKAQPIKYLMKSLPVTKSVITYGAILSDNFSEAFDVTIPKTARVGR
jgi:hypothetical protein